MMNCMRLDIHYDLIQFPKKRIVRIKRYLSPQRKRVKDERKKAKENYILLSNTEEIRLHANMFYKIMLSK